MDILSELEDFINEFNQLEYEDFSIDSIRVEYQKQHKQSKLNELGNWKKINIYDRKILAKLKKRLTLDEVTTAYQLDNHNVYYYNSSTPPKYNKATMVIFAMKQYHKDPPPYNIISSILNILVFSTSKVIVNLDVCKDFFYKPNIRELSKKYELTPFITKYGLVTDTRYINNPEITMIEKIVIYNKQVKNDLSFKVWRAEAKIIIPNIRDLALPLYEFKSEVTDLLAKHCSLSIARELN